MKSRTKFKLLILSAACLSAALIAGCGEMTKDEYLKKNHAQDQSVTYFANGGKFNGKDRDVMELYFKADSPILLDTTTNNFEVSRTDYTFDAWYYTTVDSEGNLILDENGNPVFGEPVKPNDKIGANEHKYVIAGWSANIALDVVLVTDGDFTVTAGENSYKTGDVINTVNFGTSSTLGLDGNNVGITATNATYLYFYSDEECTKPITSIAKPTEGDENVKVYAKFIEGKWTVVKNSSDVEKMLNGSGSYYLFTPDGSNVIECGDLELYLNPMNFNVKIEGNGVTLNNLNYSTERIASDCSAFGKLTGESSIKNLTFKNIKITAKVQQRAKVAVFAIFHGIEEGAQLENVKFDTVELTIERADDNNTLVTNIDRAGGGQSTENWLFGGDDIAYDSDFIENYGVTVNGANLIFNVI